MTGKLRTHLANPVTQRRDVVEPPRAEFVQMDRASTRDLNPQLAHRAHRIGVKRLGVTARAMSVDCIAGEPLDERLRDLRARAVARTEEQELEIGRASCRERV